jgi:hypothetical protein
VISPALHRARPGGSGPHFGDAPLEDFLLHLSTFLGCEAVYGAGCHEKAPLAKFRGLLMARFLSFLFFFFFFFK